MPPTDRRVLHGLLQVFGGITFCISVTSAQSCGSSGAGRDLVIAIDTTGSMGSAIEAVKQKCVQLINTAGSSPDVPVPANYVLSPFNDPTIGPLLKVSGTQAPQFIAAVSALTADGGGDMPELCLGGILAASASSGQGAVIHVFTDAAAKDAEELPIVIANLQIRQQIVNFIISTHDSFYGNGVYREITRATSGMMIDTGNTAEEISTAVGTLDDGLACDFVILVKSRSLTPIAELIVIVDSTMTQFDVIVQDNEEAPNVTLNEASRTRSMVVIPILDGAKVKMFRVKDPVPGKWTVGIRGRKAGWDVQVRGRSSIDFTYTLHKPDSKLEKFTTSPVTGDNLVLIIHPPCKGCIIQQIFFVTDGAAAYSPGAAEYFSSADAYGVRFIVPDHPVFVKVVGMKSDGATFQRQHRTPIRPTQIRVTLTEGSEPEVVIAPGSSFLMKYEIMNTGSDTEVFQKITDPLNFVAASSVSSTFHLANNAGIEASIRFTVPANATTGTTTEIVVTIGVLGSMTNTNSIRKVITVASAPITVASAPICTFPSTAFVAACIGVENDIVRCADKRWTAQVRFADADKGLNRMNVKGTYLPSAPKGILTWSQPKNIGSVAKDVVTGTATGTCCAKTVMYTVVDDQGFTGTCTLAR